MTETKSVYCNHVSQGLREPESEFICRRYADHAGSHAESHRVPAEQGTDRFVATQHWQHADWTVYDESRDKYRLRGLTEIEAIEQAAELNAQEGKS